MDTFVGKSQKIRIDVSSIEIESKKSSTFGSKHISCDKITKVDQRGNSVFISVGSGIYARLQKSSLMTASTRKEPTVLSIMQRLCLGRLALKVIPYT